MISPNKVFYRIVCIGSTKLNPVGVTLFTVYEQSLD